MFVSLPLIWLKKIISKKKDKRIPRSNIITPMSIENTADQPFGTKFHHSTSGVITIQPIQTIGEFLKDKEIFPEDPKPAFKLPFNNRKHNKNLISLTGTLILLVLTIVMREIIGELFFNDNQLESTQFQKGCCQNIAY